MFGRGAIDFKGGMAVFVRAAMMLAENGPLARDVIVLAEADERGRAGYSAPWLAATTGRRSIASSR
jgi:acetylornithine deacetylase/succinyl-diaminopimelate desuccinylase-like protein